MNAALIIEITEPYINLLFLETLARSNLSTPALSPQYAFDGFEIDNGRVSFHHPSVMLLLIYSWLFLFIDVIVYCVFPLSFNFSFVVARQLSEVNSDGVITLTTFSTSGLEWILCIRIVCLYGFSCFVVSEAWFRFLPVGLCLRPYEWWPAV